MALTITPHPDKSGTAVVACTDCSDLLNVTGVAPALLRSLVKATDSEHRCAA